MRWERVAMVVGGLALLALAWVGMRPGPPEAAPAPQAQPEPRPVPPPRPLVFTRPEPQAEDTDRGPVAEGPAPTTDADTGRRDAPPERDWDELVDLDPQVRQQVLDSAHAALAEVMRQCAPEMTTSADGVIAQAQLEIDDQGLAAVRFGSQSLSRPTPGFQNAFPADFSDCAEATLWDQDWPLHDGKLKMLLYAPVEPEDVGEPAP